MSWNEELNQKRIADLTHGIILAMRACVYFSGFVVPVANFLICSPLSGGRLHRPGGGCGSEKTRTHQSRETRPQLHDGHPTHQAGKPREQREVGGWIDSLKETTTLSFTRAEQGFCGLDILQITMNRRHLDGT